MNLPFGKQVEAKTTTYEGPLVAELVLPGTGPEVVQVIGEVGEARVFRPENPDPQPAGHGSWPPREPDPAEQTLASLTGQFWSTKQAKPSKPGDPQIF